jgi:C4-dicarboxylate-specific signal transduction histidine kinase
LGYPSELSQVILNILNNAKDILVEKEIKKPKIIIDINKHEKNIISIEIKDNGGGIDEKNIDKIFDMYFSTKDKKNGMGLGLYISKIIIENKLKGKIYAKNYQNGAIISINIKNDPYI